MKILFHSTAPFSQSEGIGRVIFGIGKELEKKGVQVDYVFAWSAPKPFFNYLELINFPILRILKHTFFSAILFSVFMRGKEFDWVHSHTPEAGFDAVWARKLLHKEYKILVQLHGLDASLLEEYQQEITNKKTDSSFFNFFYLNAAKQKSCRALREADAVTSISKAVDREAQRFFGKKTVVIPNAVDTQEFFPTKTQKRKQWGFPDSSFLVLFVGNVGWRKGLPYLVEALELLPERVRLVVAGINDRKTIQRFQQPGRIVFLPPQKTQELNEWYNAADLLVVPSINEPFGLIYIEAMAAGLPAVGCWETGAEEIISDGKNGFLCQKRNPKSIAEAIEKAMNHPNLNQLRQNAQKTARFFSWKKTAEAYLKLYTQLSRST